MKNRNTLTVTLAQTRQCADIDKNLAVILPAIKAARKAGADVACFAETALTGYGPMLYESSADFDAKPLHAALRKVKAAAKDAELSVLLGTHLPLGDGWTNSAVLISPTGRQANRYDKCHLYGGDVEFYRVGRALPKVSRIAGVRVGLQICFDIRFPEPFRLLARAGAGVTFVPSHIHGADEMWKGPVIESHVSSRAAENGRYVVFVNAAGATQNVPSMIANPRGEIIAKARKGARELLTVKFDLTRVNDVFLDCLRGDLY